MRRLPAAITLALVLGGNSASSAAEAAESADAGKFSLDLRLRSETVADDAFQRQAEALTLRGRFGYRTSRVSHWSAFVEVEGSTHLSGAHYNSSANGQTMFPPVTDPDNAELNQALVNYAPSERTRLSLGRQRLLYDNQRFFGNVGWRQNEQTFDALDAQHRFGNGLTLRYSYLDRVQRVFGDEHPVRNLARWQLDAHLLALSRVVGPGNATVYAHFIDNQTLPMASHRNFGLRYTARHEAPDALGWLLNAEVAWQSEYAGAAPRRAAAYQWLEAGLLHRGHSFRAGWERLGGDGRHAFQTPFASLHAFNGWADKFLTTPVNGLEDRYLGWSRSFGRIGAAVAWHDYRSDRGQWHYGSEWDASLSWVFAPRWTALAKMADYRADAYARDTRKLWLSAEFVY